MNKKKLNSLILKPNETLRQYVIQSSLNRHSRNQIYKAVIPNCEKMFFLKAQQYETPKEKYYFDSETEILDQLKENENILKHVDHIKQDFPIKIKGENGETYEIRKTFVISVMPFYQYYDLQKFYSAFVNKANKQEMNRQILYKSLLILKDLHIKRIVHHDIKPQNFLVRSPDPLDIVLTDFEFSIQLKENEKVGFKCGTLPFMAPEILNGENHDMAVDIWSLGVMMYYFSRGVYPFGILSNDTKETIKEKIKNKKRPTFGRYFSRILGNLLIRMLETDPKKRITVDNALTNSYFDNINLNSFQNDENYISSYSTTENATI